MEHGQVSDHLESVNQRPQLVQSAREDYIQGEVGDDERGSGVHDSQ